MTIRDRTIGMIGIGLMGHGIATNIVKNGWPLVFLDHPGNQPVDDLVKAGARPEKSCKAVAEACGVIILCVTGTPQVEDAIAGSEGLLEGISPGTIIIDCSTAIPESTRRMSQKVAAMGGHFVDAPMTRTPKEAAQGKLNLIVGAEKELYEECLPLLESFAENIVHAGGVGSGHALKLLHNFVSLGFVALLAEASACARKANIDPEILVDVLAKGGGGGVALDRLAPMILDGDASAMRFSIANANKDLAYYDTMAKDLAAANNMAEATGRMLQAVCDKGKGEQFMPELVELLLSKKSI